LLPAFCTALPIRVIARLLGVPESMSDRLLAWSHAMVAMYQAGRTYDTEVAADRAATEFTAFLSDYIEARRNTPGDDLISHLIAAETKDGTLSRAEMIGTCVLLLNAGHEATVHMLGNAVKTLLEWQTPLDAISPEHAERTVEELLRFDPPLHIFTRFAYQDVEIAGRHLQAGEDVMLVLGAAGRDPRTVQHPNRFDPFRISAPHAAFGGGLHFCLGAALARMEMRIGLQRLFATAPRLRLAAPPRYADSYHFHGLERLMVIR
jgi:unspecific monooxygenase